MTKVDERSVVPPVDVGARVRLAAALDVEGVVSARLFGSQATGRSGPLSDVDVGVWLTPALSRDERDALCSRLAAAAEVALRTVELDLIVLNDATPLLRHRAMRDGSRLLDRDATVSIRLERDALLEYLDTAPLRRELTAALRRRIAEGRFGRP